MLAHGERVGGYQSLGDLDDIPGFAAGLLDQLKARPRL
jgi:DNA uptake protein ComE-like DNA-binding protein